MGSNTPLSQLLLSTLTSAPQSFLQPQQNLHSSALALAKQYLDPLASGVSEVQHERQRQNRKRKRDVGFDEVQKPLGVKKVHVEGFDVDQIWEQARRVLDATKAELERAVPDVAPQKAQANGVNGAGASSDEEEDDEGVDSEDEDGLANGEVESGEEEEGMSGEDEEDDMALDGSEDDGEEAEELNGIHDDYEEEDEDEEDFDDAPAEEYIPDPNGLNDGFFSIDDFNKQTDFLEQQDARGDPDDGQNSDEEDVDWHSNPMADGGVSLKLDGEDDESDDEEGDGPTFGNMDLNVPEGASDDGEDEDDDLDLGGDDMGGLSNANEIMYADFFAPPAQKAGKNKKKRGRPNPHNFPEGGQPSRAAQPDDAELDRAMASVHRDLFSEEDEDSEDALSDVDPGDPKSRRSTHERRQAKIFQEIRELEAANVAKRQWTLLGEARAADRPLNSLLEEDLDFERAGKPVPVITAEVSEDIEALIKRRILASQFDELTRRRPNDLATGPSRRGLYDLPDTKSSKTLAEIYEEDHRAKNDPSYVSATDAKTKAAHDEISALWKDVSAKLDALSSWHYKPKPAAPALEVRVDAPALSLEDARPTAGGDIGSASQLAPQEVYKPSTSKVDGEDRTRGGMPVAREELSREDKLRRRRREKERKKKAEANKVITIKRDGTEKVDGNGKEKGKKREKEVVDALKKGGVKVIGKKGELTSVDGKKVKEGQEARATGGSYRL